MKVKVALVALAMVAIGWSLARFIGYWAIPIVSPVAFFVGYNV